MWLFCDFRLRTEGYRILQYLILYRIKMSYITYSSPSSSYFVKSEFLCTCRQCSTAAVRDSAYCTVQL